MFWLMINNKCKWCGRTGVKIVPKHRQRTAYQDDRLNWVEGICEDCAEENKEYWNEMWEDYYASVL